MSSAPSAPNLPSAPSFSGTQIYDENGNLTGSISRDASGNIVYNAGKLSPADEINKKAVTTQANSLLGQLSKTPSEWTAEANQGANAWAANQNKAVQDQFGKDVNQIGAVSNERGLLGSKAYADIMGQREKTLADTTTQIQNDAATLSQNLLNNKISQTEGLYGLYNNAANQYTSNANALLSQAGGLSNQANQYNLSQYNSQLGALNSNYQNRLSEWENNDPWKNYIMPLAASGAMVATKASDRRLKKDIIPAFKTGDVQWYSFEYDADKWPKGVIKPPAGYNIGVMADEVRHIPDVVKPEAFYGFDMVDYEVLRRYLHMENA